MAADNAAKSVVIAIRVSHIYIHIHIYIVYVCERVRERERESVSSMLKLTPRIGVPYLFFHDRGSTDGFAIYWERETDRQKEWVRERALLSFVLTARSQSSVSHTLFLCLLSFVRETELCFRLSWQWCLDTRRQDKLTQTRPFFRTSDYLVIYTLSLTHTHTHTHTHTRARARALSLSHLNYIYLYICRLGFHFGLRESQCSLAVTPAVAALVPSRKRILRSMRIMSLRSSKVVSKACQQLAKHVSS